MDVITLTGNLLAEWTFETKALQPGTTHRAEAMTFQVGGKGVNVSRILKRLGSDSLAIGFAEGPMANLCSEWLENNSIPHKFFPLEQGVRPGVVVREFKGTQPETTFLGQDLPLPVTSWKATSQYVEQDRPKWLAICGSIPGWSGSWSRNIRQIAEAGTRVAVDTYGPPLSDLVKIPVDLVKVNRNELVRIYPEAEKLSLLEAITHAKKSSPVRNWIVTDGPRSIAAVFESGDKFEIVPAKIKEVSPTGSGDSFLAAILNKWPANGKYTDALAFASACATANAASSGIGDFPLPVPERFFPEIKKPD
nr:PfkB family carbohydrate kinase [Oceanipulchritudo coccoides]